MQVYKVFFRILAKHKSSVILYFGLFIGLATLVSNINSQENSGIFRGSEFRFTVFDEDRSEISEGLISYLETDHERVEIEDEEETIQDELYNRNTNCVMRIPAGFGRSFEQGEVKKIEMTSIPGSVYKGTFENLTNNYAALLKSYMAGGFGLQQALERTGEVCREKAKVELAEDGTGSYSKMYYYFLYVPYIFISICVGAVGPILIVFRRREVRERQQCASYSALRMQGELFAGCATVGAGLCLLYYILTFCGAGMDVVRFRGYLNALNMVCFAVVALGLTFLICQFVKKTHMLSMIYNIIGLGCSFLSGIFVPLELLGDGVIRVAHFLPSYWYVVAAVEIDGYHAGDPLGQIWFCMGIELLFALAFVCTGLAYNRKQYTCASF